MTAFERRRLLTAELLSIGSELTVGETRDTNAGELARSLTGMGVRVTRLTALPDDLDQVTEAFTTGLGRADLVVSTGGLGPTPDDLTREAIAAACGETPAVDAGPRGLAARPVDPARDAVPRAQPQAGLADPVGRRRCPTRTGRRRAGSSTGRTAGSSSPCPDRRARCARCGRTTSCHASSGSGLGAEVASRTYRLAGIGESQVAELLGEALLRATNPIVATYARVEAVDVRVSAVAEAGRTADELVEAAAAVVLGHLGEHVWATGETTWSQALGARLGELGWTLAVVEIGTGGSLGALLGDEPWVRFDESIASESPAARSHGGDDARDGADDRRPHAGDEPHGSDDLVAFARRARELGGADVGIAVRARPRTGDTAVSIAIVTPLGERRIRRLVFLTGPMGRSRAALAAAAVLLETLRDPDATD